MNTLESVAEVHVVILNPLSRRLWILYNKIQLAALRTSAYPLRPLRLNILNRRERREYAELRRGNSCS